jgi:hypothetical protein
VADDVFQQLTRLVNDPSLPPSVNNALRTARNHYLDETAREAEGNDKLVRQLIKDELSEHGYRIMKRRRNGDQYWVYFADPMTLGEICDWIDRDLARGFCKYVDEALASDNPWSFTYKGVAE